MGTTLFLSSTKTSWSFLSLVVISLQLLWPSQVSLSFSSVVHNNISFTICPYHQKATLLQFKHGFSIQRGYYGNSSSRIDSWNPEIDCCIWQGITCDEDTGHVIALDLSSSDDLASSWIKGRIDSSIFQLQSLQMLNLSWNDFYPNPIPFGLGQLTNLTHLNLSNCGFARQIPLELSQLTKLVSLDLSSIYYEGDMLQLKNPSLITLIRNYSHLEELFLDHVNISEHRGEWALALFSALPNLRKLSLTNCGLSGPIGHLFWLPFLSQLSLSDNNLSSVVEPFFLCNSSSLTSLRLQYCGLYGKFPESIFLLPNLQTLDISGNFALTVDFQEFPNNSTLQHLYMGSTIFQVNPLNTISNIKFLKTLSLPYCNLSGPLPSSIANLTHLEYLVLSSNNFTGTIPSSYQNGLQHLSYLTLEKKFLKGSILESLFSHPSLKSVDLGWNRFSDLPDNVQNASSSLREIYLHRNKFQGPIPKFIFKFMHLETLYLSSNNFSGTVQLLDMFLNFKNLSVLDLSDNSLSVIIANDSSNLISSSQLQVLHLRSCNISEFPNILRNLNQLSYVDLSNNKIHGEIPNWVWKVGNGTLQNLNLSHNFFESLEHPLPKVSLSFLYSVDLHSNKLQGPIPIMPPIVEFQDYSKNNFSSIMSREINLTFVSFFSLSDNNIHGEIPLSICNAKFLSFLDLSNNKLSGRIPRCLGKISNSLKILNLKNNSFYGTIPQSFTKTCSMVTLNVRANQLDGPMPRSLANCEFLEVIDVGNNQINDTFPFWFANLPHLRILILHSNKFHGPITHSHLNSPSSSFLQIFDISSNLFTGPFPSGLFLNWNAMMGDISHKGSNGQIVRYLQYLGGYYQESVTLTIKGLDVEFVKVLTALTSVDISNNSFEGRIEDAIGNLNLLHVLNFSQNNFIGPIPASLGNLTALESLDLSQNNLSGEIPIELLKLTFLEVFNVSYNLLVGRIPQGQQFYTFNNDSFLGNVGLCGSPLSRNCEDAKALPPSKIDVVRAREIDLRMMWIGFEIGYGVGVGLVLWTLVLWKKGCRKYMQLVDGVVYKLF